MNVREIDEGNVVGNKRTSFMFNDISLTNSHSLLFAITSVFDLKT